MFVVRGVAEGFTGAGTHGFGDSAASCSQRGLRRAAEAAQHCVHQFAGRVTIVFLGRGRMLLRARRLPGKFLGHLQSTCKHCDALGYYIPSVLNSFAHFQLAVIYLS